MLEETTTTKIPSAIPIKLWRPSNTPWRAEKRGTETYLWYRILDDMGNEIFFTERVPLADEGSIEGEVALLLSSVNKSKVVTIDNVPRTIEWYGGR